MMNFCTLFDHNYIARGIVLYKSLKDVDPNFMLHVLCMGKAEGILRKLKENWFYDDMILYNLDSPILPRNEMIIARGNRTWQEFCWTMASVFCDSLMRSGHKAITYLDSDMMFFSNPAVIFEELGEKGIGIIPHRFIPEKKHLEINGIYNVSWVTFKATLRGLLCLKTWAKQCLEWCYYKVEKDRFGDQKYLDSWPKKYG